MKYWESAKFMELLEVWDKQSHPESDYHQQQLLQCPSKYSYLLSYDEDERHDLETHLELPVKCPECGAEYTYYLDAVTHKVYNIPAYYKECPECGENIHLMSNMIRKVDEINEPDKSSGLSCINAAPKADGIIARCEPKDEDYQVHVYHDHVSVYNEKTGLHIKLRDLSPRKAEDESEHIRKILTAGQRKKNNFKFSNLLPMIFILVFLTGMLFEAFGAKTASTTAYIIGSLGISGIVLLMIFYLLRYLISLLIRVIRYSYSYAKKYLMIHTLASIICVLLLLIALIGGDRHFMWENYALPQGFFNFTRLAVTASTSYICYLFVKNKTNSLLILTSAGLVLLFQPIVPVTFEHSTWCWLDVFSIPVLLFLAHVAPAYNHL